MAAAEWAALATNTRKASRLVQQAGQHTKEESVMDWGRGFFRLQEYGAIIMIARAELRWRGRAWIARTVRTVAIPLFVIAMGTAHAQTFDGHAFAKDGDDLIIAGTEDRAA